MRIFIILAMASMFIILALRGMNLTEGVDWVFYFSLVLVGAMLGASLNYFQFGFSSSFRALILESKTAGMRSIVIMLAIAILLFAPLIYMQEWQQINYFGFIRPLSLSIPIGAFLFGIGMQISCGCTSGTLNRLGQLQALALPTLFFMIIGGTLAAATFSEWRDLPSLPPFAFQAHFEWPLAVLMQLTLLGVAYLLLMKIELQKNKTVESLFNYPTKTKIADSSTDSTVSKAVNRTWHPFLMAAIALAGLNGLLFFISGSPWSISSVFPYWGTQFISSVALPIDWQFWDYAMENQNTLSSNWLQHQVVLTTLGVISGALLVSLFKPRSKVPLSMNAFLMSMLGGTIMGFGAVIASGCNIGAFFSGIASGSLHGWIWFAFALLGNMIGLKIKAKLML